MPYRWTLTDLVAPYVGSLVLTKDPIGWDNGVYTIMRSDVYKGAFHEYSTELKFHCNGGGKEYIDAIYASEDIDGRIDVLVEYDCDGSGNYDVLFNGIIDLSSYRTDGEYTVVKIEKSDLLTKLFNRDEISVDLETTTSIGGFPITAPDTVTLPLSSMAINYYDIWRIPNGYSYNYLWNVGTVPPLAKRTVLTMELDNSDIDTATSVTELSIDVPGLTLDPFSPLVVFNDNTIIYPLSIDWSINWKGTFTDNNSDVVNLRTTAHAFLILQYGDPNGTPTQIILYSDTFTTDSYTTSFNIVSSGTININAGDSIWLNWFVDETAANDVSVTWTFTEDSTFQITTDTLAVTTNAKSLLIHEAFNQVVDAIADSDGKFYSEYYGRTDSQKRTYPDDGCGSKIAVTNGLNIREFDTKKIYASFKDLFESMDCIHNIGMGIVSGLVRVEPLSYWFDGSTEIISLPLVNTYESSNDNTKYINKVEIGYQKWESEFKGGLDDPNAKHEYSTIISSVKNAYSRLCKYITSPYTIEFTRRKNKSVLATEDWRYDNDNFLVALTNEYNGEIIFTATNTIRINGLFYNFQIGDTLTITGTALNNGTFTIATVTQLINRTIITVVEAIATETVTATITDSTNKIYKPELYVDSFSYGAGMTALTSAYNLRLTPARMLLAHIGTIVAGLQIIRGAIKFVRGDGNTNLECSATVAIYTDGCQEEYKSQQLKENQNFQWNDNNAINISPIWGTEKYSFEYPLSYSEFKLIKANPYGYITFYKFADDVKAGFLLSMEYQMKTGLTKFELLKKA